MGTDKCPDPISPDILIDLNHLDYIALVELSRYIAKTVEWPNGLCQSKIEWVCDPNAFATNRRLLPYCYGTLAPSAILKCAEVNPTFRLALKVHD
jgi:hypothetical protein